MGRIFYLVLAVLWIAIGVAWILITEPPYSSIHILVCCNLSATNLILSKMHGDRDE